MPWEPSGPRPALPPAPVERTLWRVQKDVRAAEARVRVFPHGDELRIVLRHPAAGESLLWSRLYPRHEAGDLEIAAAGTKADFVRLGWA